MSYHGSQSPPDFQPAILYTQTPPVFQNRDIEQHTPKRRRMEAANLLDLNNDHRPLLSTSDFYDVSFPAAPDFNFPQGPSQNSNPAIEQSSSQPTMPFTWHTERQWNDLPLRSQSSHDGYDQALGSRSLTDDVRRTNACTHPPPNHIRNSAPSFLQTPEEFEWMTTSFARTPYNVTPFLPPSSSPPRHQPPAQYLTDQNKCHMQPTPPSLRLPHMPGPFPASLPPTAPVIQDYGPPPRRRGSVTLILSRATIASIESIPEHKRECPACQLEFESDNYLAIISCCGTGMHATCLSAWVNSQTYAKTKVCMKCRKPIDARRPLNNVVPPVSDKSWDEGMDLNAPESVQGETKIELDVGARSRPGHRQWSHLRRTSGFVRRRPNGISMNEVPPELRSDFAKLHAEHIKQADTLRVRYSMAYNAWQAAFEAEVRAAHVAADAKESLQARTGITPREVQGLVERCREAREIQEERHAAFREALREQDALERDHQRQVSRLLHDPAIPNQSNASAGTEQLFRG